MDADQMLKEVSDFLTERRHDLRDARDAAAQQLQAEPGNGVAIEKLRVLGTLQTLQVELARTTAINAEADLAAASSQ